MKSRKTETIVWIAVAAVLLAALGGLLYSGPQTNTPADSGNDITFSLTVTTGGKDVLYDSDVTVAEGTSLIDAITENITENGGVVYESGEYGAFITGICGHEQNYDTGEYWMFTVNGETLMVGASDYCPAEGDQVVFDLSVVEW